MSEHPFDILARCGARKSGHFVLSSWRHSDTYVDKRELTVIPRHASTLCLQFSDRYRGKGIQAVAGFAVGSIAPSFEVARLLSLYEDRDVKHIILEKDEARGSKQFKLSSAHARHVKGQLVLPMEDIVTSGDSFDGGIKELRRAGGVVEEVSCIWNRGSATAEKLEVPSIFSLINERLDDWSEEECPLCKSGVLIELMLGRGAEYVAKHGQPKAA